MARRAMSLFRKRAGEVRDTFDTRTSPSAMGRAPTGQIWRQLPNPTPNGNGVLSGKAYLSAVVSQRSLIDCGFANGSVSATFDTLGGSASVMHLLARVTLAGNNNLASELEVRADATSWKLFRRTLNGVTTLLNVAQTPLAGDVAKLTMRGALLELFVNGTSIGTATDGQNMGATRHGLLLASDTTARIDTFLVKRAA